MPSRSPPLKPWTVGGASHGSRGPGLGTASLDGEAVREDLVEDRFPDPVRRIDRHPPANPLALHAADGQAADDPALEEDVDDRDGQ